jgi:dTDP-glucose pyrophosphorylase
MMPKDIDKHLINIESSIKDALTKLDYLASDAILFVVNNENILLGSITDGDIRRGMINGKSIDCSLSEFMQSNPKYILDKDYRIDDIIEYRDDFLKIIPIIDSNRKVINILNFRLKKSYLPIDAVIMAGGRGVRLQPLTDKVPKPLLKIGDKPIIEHGIDRLVQFGIENVWISINYLGEQIEAYFGDGSSKDIKIEYVKETKPLGTVGAVSNINNFEHDYILITNSDLLSNVDYESFFLEFLKEDADFSVLTIPYQISVPYAIIETEGKQIKQFKEKPTYTYFANGGIYLMKKEILNYIPKNTFFNTTDLMEKLIVENFKVISFPFLGYWLDVGKHEDFEKAKNDIKNIKE